MAKSSRTVWRCCRQTGCCRQTPGKNLGRGKNWGRGTDEDEGDGEVGEHLPQDCWQKPDIQLWLHWPQAACWAQVKVLPGALSVQELEPPEVALATLWVLMVAVGATPAGLGLLLGLLLGLGDLLGVVGVVGTSSCMRGPGSVLLLERCGRRTGRAAGHCKGLLAWQFRHSEELAGLQGMLWRMLRTSSAHGPAAGVAAV